MDEYALRFAFFIIFASGHVHVLSWRDRDSPEFFVCAWFLLLQLLVNFGFPLAVALNAPSMAARSQSSLSYVGVGVRTRMSVLAYERRFA